MNNELEQAIHLLYDNGYIVKKVTERMKKDCKKCEEMSSKDEDMNCLECSCSICIMQ